MKEYIEERVLTIAEYIIESRATVREAAKRFGVSKSTVHMDMTKRLTEINSSLSQDVRRVLDVNKQERHLRGGMATREKYLHMKGNEE
ncbi:MAG: sporulation transcriptional regulator SpoIIID [Lachnospiraceae bacterium]|nr:sporulation transcriptional regulator SpoIIID [Lachnospiraceae bacterium]MCD7842457.1 sporulation transcriptional regulator SpoIIID [Lachnospiraceae bacterium]